MTFLLGFTQSFHSYALHKKGGLVLREVLQTFNIHTFQIQCSHGNISLLPILVVVFLKARSLFHC